MVILAIALVAFVIFAAVGCAVALIAGQIEERRAALGYLLTIVATQVASLGGPRWHGPEYGVMLVDAAFAVWLAQIAGKSSKWWPIWAAACQLAGTLSHLTPIFSVGLPKWLYLIIQPIWAFPLLGAILYGVWQTVSSRAEPVDKKTI